MKLVSVKGACVPAGDRTVGDREVVSDIVDHTVVDSSKSPSTGHVPDFPGSVPKKPYASSVSHHDQALEVRIRPE